LPALKKQADTGKEKVGRVISIPPDHFRYDLQDKRLDIPHGNVQPCE